MTKYAIREVGVVLEDLFVAVSTDKPKQTIFDLQDKLREVTRSAENTSVKDAVNHVISASESIWGGPKGGILRSSSVGEFGKYAAVILDNATDPSEL